MQKRPQLDRLSDGFCELRCHKNLLSMFMCWRRGCGCCVGRYALRFSGFDGGSCEGVCQRVWVIGVIAGGYFDFRGGDPALRDGSIRGVDFP